MKKALNLGLLLSFLVTIAVPVTGIPIHKLASALFGLLCVVHTIVYRNILGVKRWLLLALVSASFASGVLGLILETVPQVLILHRVLSIGAVFFLAIHIYVFRRRFGTTK